ncbi:MAG: hypothetical protein JNL42_05470 [Anaerolineae bacterium]|nr:hypothetical protein [Anaerolineae bacterium]
MKSVGGLLLRKVGAACNLKAASFANVTYKTFMFGTMAVHWGEKLGR